MPYKYFNQEIYEIYVDRYIGYDDKGIRDKIEDGAVYINNVSYIDKDDYEYLDYLKMIGEGKVLGEYAFGNYMGKHLLTIEEVRENSYQNDIDNTIEIRDKCNVEFSYIDGLLPIYDSNIDSREYLNVLSHKGLNKRLNGVIKQEYEERLNYEL